MPRDLTLTLFRSRYERMKTEYIRNIELDERNLLARNQAEREVAMRDLITENYFSLVDSDSPPGPYDLRFAVQDSRISMEIKASGQQEGIKIAVPTGQFRSLIKDYFLICESYEEAVKSGSMDKVEAIDMGRRAMHNEGAELIVDALKSRVNIDFDTARRLFTVISSLHMK